MSSTTGTIVRLVQQRGFGFIRTEDGSEIFFHATGTAEQGAFDQMYEGQRVSYVKERDSRGRGDRAVNVQPA